MSMNMAEKILANHSTPHQDVVEPSEFVVVNVDTVGLLKAPLPEYRYIKTWNPDKMWLVDEHRVPCFDVDCAEAHRINKVFAKKYGLRWIEHGRQGISHQLAAELGFHIPGGIYACQDSHTTAGGGLNCASKGVGPLEIASIVAKGKTWYRCAPTVKFVLVGKMPKMVMARDINIYIGGKWPPFVNMNAEFLGPVADSMSLDGRRCVATAATELSFDFALFKVDKKALDYVKERTPFPELINPVEPDEDAKYANEITIDVTDLDPQIAYPHRMANVAPVQEIDKKRVKIDMAFVGACTNGRIEDIKMVADILRGKTIDPDVRLIVTPASQEIFKEAIKLGYANDIAEAEGIFTASRCDPCSSGQLGTGEVAVGSQTRNYKGRMGSPEAFVYCASPATVATSALTGYITDPREV